MDNECLFDMIRLNAISKFLSYFPRWKQISEPIEKNYLSLCAKIDTIFVSLSSDPATFVNKVISPLHLQNADRKKVKEQGDISYVLFGMQKEQCTASDYLAHQDRKKTWKMYFEYIKSLQR